MNCGNFVVQTRQFVIELAVISWYEKVGSGNWCWDPLRSVFEHIFVTLLSISLWWRKSSSTDITHLLTHTWVPVRTNEKFCLRKFCIRYHTILSIKNSAELCEKVLWKGTDDTICSIKLINSALLLTTKHFFKSNFSSFQRLMVIISKTTY